MARIGRSSKTPASPDFATVRIRSDFLVWLKQESVRRGIFLYQLVEELASSRLAGASPWRKK